MRGAVPAVRRNHNILLRAQRGLANRLNFMRDRQERREAERAGQPPGRGGAIRERFDRLMQRLNAIGEEEPQREATDTGALRRLRNELEVKESLLREKDEQLLQRERQYTQTIRKMKRQQNILLEKLGQLESAINATLGAGGLPGVGTT